MAPLVEGARRELDGPLRPRRQQQVGTPLSTSVGDGGVMTPVVLPGPSSAAAAPALKKITAAVLTARANALRMDMLASSQQILTSLVKIAQHVTPVPLLTWV